MTEGREARSIRLDPVLHQARRSVGAGRGVSNVEVV